MSKFNEKYGKWALITGATSGIGKALAYQLAESGVNIILVARKEKELKEEADSIQTKFKVETKTISADLSTEKGLKAIIDSTTEMEVGLLVLAAGLEVNGAFEKLDIKKELQLIQINITATVQLTHHFIPLMINRGKGGVLFVSSLSGHMPNPYFANYAGSKSYALNFGASLYGELKPKGIDIAVLSPGLTDTPMIVNNGVDWSKTPMTALSPEKVAKEGLNALGKKFLAVPGRKNKMMAAMAKHSPLHVQAKMNEKMMRKAIHPSKL